MSDSEDFLFQIDAGELYPEVAVSKKRKCKKKSRREKKKKMKISKLIPSHFIAFQIYDSVIRQKIVDVQKKIIEINPLLKKALIDVRTLHVTLAVTHLENEEKGKELKERLQDWSEKNISQHFSEPMHLTFSGIGAFGKGVIYVKIDECSNYNRLCHFSGAVNNFLSSSGFYSDCKKFTPHLTLLKLSKNYRLYKEKKNVWNDLAALQDCQEHFGRQEVKNIQLLSMRDKKDDNGYYNCLWQMPTSSSPNEENIT